MFPSVSDTRPCGPELSTFNGNSLNAAVAGSTRPILFCICSVNHSAPSMPTAGSCGWAPLVGTSHSLMVTCRSVTSFAAGGTSWIGEFASPFSGFVIPTGAALSAIAAGRNLLGSSAPPLFPDVACYAITPAVQATTSIPVAPIPLMVVQFVLITASRPGLAREGSLLPTTDGLHVERLTRERPIRPVPGGDGARLSKPRPQAAGGPALFSPSPAP